jgi:pimeloyl-ACP methyl ester carboxylesterase
MTQVQLSTIKADGVNVFYRSAGSPCAPVLLLLHGFPASSFQFRELIPLLAWKFRVLAPDLPAFGFTEVPAERNYQYTFDSLSVTIEAFLDALNVRKFAVYIFDYGVRTLFPFPFPTASQR